VGAPGLSPTGGRKGYYFDTGEDALVMEAKLAPEEQQTSRGNQRNG